ncbi:unnamed protein product [Dracunculus medinensis]|uniref:GTP-bdg_N domain-containing protein n=1 Tax=Dracunculus medinensis TaxID=318479 RepID=A0A0N4UQK3_DRAME|nr:unnamed protein product [Dracunculus medinensis]
MQQLSHQQGITESGFGQNNNVVDSLARRRITLPGGCTIDSLKKIVENAMKKGHVIDVLTLPDLIPIRTEDQVQALAQSQKVEVLFENEDQLIDIWSSTKFINNYCLAMSILILKFK